MGAHLTIVMKQKAMIQLRLKMKLLSKNGCTVIVRMAIYRTVVTIQVNILTAIHTILDVMMQVLSIGLIAIWKIEIVNFTMAVQLTDVKTQICTFKTKQISKNG